MSFQAPVKDMLFNIEHLARINEDVATLPAFEGKDLETAQMVLEACAQFNQDV
ncbi:MAG: acyl-CoA dehydrogenase N-terminal domain-containing protein, partial [Ottowia sp.]|nr:acyl-CoA dehydrogenase N-terminal domain-containing protein [Ottowia sp.]